MELPIVRDRSPATRAEVTKLQPSASAQIDLTAAEVEDDAVYRTHRRFDRAARLFSEPGLHALMHSRVLVIGVGGVGSFAAEALSRSGVGRICLVDFDRVCITNTNRQLQAMQGTIGKRKVDVMAERLRLIHPTGIVETLPQFYQAETRDSILTGRIDFVVDAIDNLSAKADLLATCYKCNIPVVSSMGAAARMDPTAVRICDLGATYNDAFAGALRKILRQEHGLIFDKHAPLGISAVFSPEEAILPAPVSYDEGVGFRCVCPGGKNGLHDCDRRARIDGTASFVTGAFGLAAASVVVKTLTLDGFSQASRANPSPRST